MRLQEIYSRFHEENFKGIDFIGDGEGIREFDVVVEYDYEGGSYSDHPYGNGHAREHHAPTVIIHSIKTTSKVEQHNDKDEVIRTWPVGTDVKRLPGYKTSDEEYFIDKLAEQDHD